MVIVQHPTEPNPNEPRCYSKTIEIGRGKTRTSGYLAHSDRIGPGVVVLHEFFGLTDHFKAYCDSLCDEGFTALAIDLYDGRVATDVAAAETLAGSLDEDVVMRKVEAAAEHLLSNWHPRLGIIGFSLGGFLAAEFAMRREVEASVHYYAARPLDPTRFRGPLLAHLAEHDDWEPLEEVRDRMIAQEDAGIDLDVHVYQATGHWFANSDTDAYDEPAAALAFERTTEFLHHHLA